MFDLAMLAPERIRPIRADEYMRLSELGIFDDEKVELLAGVIVAMSSQGDDHAYVTTLLANVLTKRVDERWVVPSNVTLQLTMETVPEPDVWVVPFIRDRPLRKPVLVAEVSRTSLNKDREIKRRLYAAAGVPEYWIVNLRKREVEVYTRPAGDDYERVHVATRADTLHPRFQRGLAIPVSDFLPAKPLMHVPRRRAAPRRRG
jgi:Uma2 family endonuclease